MTESASLMVERDNKLIFIVNLKAGKSDVKKAVEELYEVKVKRKSIYSSPLKASKKLLLNLLQNSKHQTSQLN